MMNPTTNLGDRNIVFTVCIHQPSSVWALRTRGSSTPYTSSTKKFAISTQAETISVQDLAEETLITYPVDKHRLDIMAKLFIPANIQPKSLRTTDLTQMLIQLVASGRGIAALPDWVVNEYEQKGWVASRRLSCAAPNGLRRTLYAGYRAEEKDKSYFEGFLKQLEKFSQKRSSYYSS